MPGVERRPIGQEKLAAFSGAGLPGAAGGNGERDRVVNSIGLLQGRLGEAIRRFTEPGQHLDKTVPPHLHVDREQAALIIQPSLPERYTQVARILRAAELIFQAEQQPGLDIRTSLKKEFSPLVDLYGLTIVDGNYKTVSDYYSRREAHLEQYKDIAEARTEYVLRYNLEFLRVPAARWEDAKQEGRRQRYYYPLQQGSKEYKAESTPGFEQTDWKHYVPQGMWSHLPSIHEFTSIINSVEDLQATIVGASKNSSPRTWGIGTSELLDLADFILWQGFNGRELTAQDLTNMLNSVLYRFDLHVDIKEDQETNQQFKTELSSENGERSAFSQFLPLLHQSVSLYHLQDRQTRIDGMGIDIDHVWKEAQAVPEAAATALKLKWAYYAYTLREQGSYYQGKAIREYSEYQTENGRQGNVVRGIEIHDGEEKQTFLWMLDQAGIPHKLGEGDICIPFLPMEREMQRTIRRKARRWFSKDR